jgi:8-oxo-dGTP pyrophosphatase MutT (NUDIX family)
MNEDVFHLGIKALIQNTEAKILILKVNIKGLKGFSGEAYWDIPGGRVKLGDSVEETLKREIEEETGITKVEVMEKIDMVLSNNIRIPNPQGGTFGLILAVYKCKTKSTEVKVSEEHVDYKWANPQEAAKLLEIKYPKEFTEKIALL